MQQADRVCMAQLANNVIGFQDLLGRDELKISPVKRIMWEAHFQASATLLAIRVLEMVEASEAD